METIALVGAKGYIGSVLYEELQKNKRYKTQAVIRTSYGYWKKRKFDIVINAAMPSARYWAQNNPSLDFSASVETTADIVYNWKYKKLVQISTISARSEVDSVYGRNKAAAEVLCNFDRNLIVRLTATFGKSLKKGALIDIINNRKVFVSGESRYSFASTDFVCRWISGNLHREGLMEIGAKNSLSLMEISNALHLPVEFSGRVDIQEVQNPRSDFPDAKEVLGFLKQRLKQ